MGSVLGPLTFGNSHIMVPYIPHIAAISYTSDRPPHDTRKYFGS